MFPGPPYHTKGLQATAPIPLSMKKNPARLHVLPSSQTMPNMYNPLPRTCTWTPDRGMRRRCTSCQPPQPPPLFEKNSGSAPVSIYVYESSWSLWVHVENGIEKQEIDSEIKLIVGTCVYASQTHPHGI